MSFDDLPPILSAFVTTFLASVGPLLALILVLVRARGRVRTIGTIGAVLLLISTVGGGLISLFLPRMLQDFHLSSSTAALFFVPTNVISWVGTILLGVAVVIRVRHGSSGHPIPAGPA